MRKYLFIIQDDVCNANGKDVNATQLLQVMQNYGKVVDFDVSVASIKNEYQSQIDNLMTQYNLIKDQKLTTDEMDVVVAYRRNKERVLKVKDEQIADLELKIENVKSEKDAFVSKLKAVIGE